MRRAYRSWANRATSVAMRLWLGLFGIAFAFGCAKDVTKDLEDLATRACACAEKKDAACGKAVLDEMVKLGETKNVKGDERKAAEAARRLGECLMASGVSSTEISHAIRKQPGSGSGSDAAPPPTPPTPTPTPESGSAGSGSAVTGSGSGSGR